MKEAVISIQRLTYLLLSQRNLIQREKMDLLGLIYLEDQFNPVFFEVEILNRYQFGSLALS